MSGIGRLVPNLKLLGVWAAVIASALASATIVVLGAPKC